MKLLFSVLTHSHAHLFYAWLQQVSHMHTMIITTLMAMLGRKQSTSQSLLTGSNVTWFHP